MNAEQWSGDDDVERWDFSAESAAEDDSDSLGYEAALPGLQWLYAHDDASAAPGAEPAP